ncbi:hypothetical protein BDM02DRAFT_1062164 [Thelephora ganbajun]|uniref:Uncharacterized protein n=1 Tax=Thelephora ganbajun TaxID=370292 RepID=A0ACB6Z3S9_THEGA|nr:hypothetical protein BDM02DRAFT_1062164 [Thelephora ganbajun]
MNPATFLTQCFYPPLSSHSTGKGNQFPKINIKHLHGPKREDNDGMFEKGLISASLVWQTCEHCLQRLCIAYSYVPYACYEIRLCKYKKSHNSRRCASSPLHN